MFNLDLPKDGEGYVHRGGRAGRLGRPGKVVSIVTPAQEFAVRRLGNGVGIGIKRINLGRKSSQPRRPGKSSSREDNDDPEGSEVEDGVGGNAP